MNLRQFVFQTAVSIHRCEKDGHTLLVCLSVANERALAYQSSSKLFRFWVDLTTFNLFSIIFTYFLNRITVLSSSPRDFFIELLHTRAHARCREVRRSVRLPLRCDLTAPLVAF